ncbi:MAG: hypothetical protein HY655_00015 [Acidobacteria bacterium]|nr:hypothetical protein [Acidobacteriota bacterium]
MKARLTFLSGPQRGRRLVLRDEAITIGTSHAATVAISDLPTGESFAVIEKAGSSFRIKTAHPLGSLMVNGTAVQEGLLHDGDLLWLAGRHKIRFGTVPERRDACKPMRQIVRESWRAALLLDGALLRRTLFFLRDLCHCTVCDASRTTALGWAAMLVAVVFASVLAGASLVRTRAAERRVVALDRQVALSVASRRDLEQQMDRLHMTQEDEKLHAETRLGEVTERVMTADRRLQAAIETARESVALVLVGYGLYDESGGKPLRLVADDTGAPQ